MALRRRPRQGWTWGRQTRRKAGGNGGYTLVEQFGRMISDSALHDDLEFYNGIKAAARQRVSGAEIVYNAIKPYFAKRRPSAANEQPTEKQLERDLHGLLSGSKEGKLEVENENPDLSGGHHHVVDEVHAADVKKKTNNEPQRWAWHPHRPRV